MESAKKGKKTRYEKAHIQTKLNTASFMTRCRVEQGCSCTRKTPPRKTFATHSLWQNGWWDRTSGNNTYTGVYMGNVLVTISNF